MIAEQAVAAGEGRLLHQRVEPISAGTVMHQHNGFPGAADLVFQFDAINGSSIHVSHHVPP